MLLLVVDNRLLQDPDLGTWAWRFPAQLQGSVDTLLGDIPQHLVGWKIQYRHRQLVVDHLEQRLFLPQIHMPGQRMHASCGQPGQQRLQEAGQLEARIDRDFRMVGREVVAHIHPGRAWDTVAT